ncbi:MAG TPA: PilZ domain-containing protein [Amaricoccus sp.]|uniref:PilZ domain-containing protein n=1 Tax=Amaricoccus sp. TaxID=1872485 RepID=UPI002C3E8667|nr:PilZ domain-containing protein [Amaricoccus sp.]HMQ93582.1 PilZ domain-containing protein [Amaricoccus sp.]HMR52263.1 PilZ domain-containing protein [Amaricoccus sp.]HMR59699.1 PilZ domain-containing protein [Amaricoccus sp.]HMT99184.1 PilZ domain-containing protein [Amaricoccus sp.]
MSSERRNSPRSRVLRRGQIVFRSGHTAIDCVLLDLSEEGAQLRLDNWLALPRRFELRIENGPSRQAEVRYRAVERMGIRFVPEAA